MYSITPYDQLMAAMYHVFSDIKNFGQIDKTHRAILTSSLGTAHLNVILADDDEDDRDFFTEAMHSVAPSIKITTVQDGAELIDVLARSQGHLPDFIFLDLNMPCKNGTECLSEIKHSEKWKDIPVFIYSTSAHTDQVNATYKSGANLYIQKPDSFDEIKTVLKKIFSFNLQDLLQQQKKENYVFK